MVILCRGKSAVIMRYSHVNDGLHSTSDDPIFEIPTEDMDLQTSNPKNLMYLLL